MKQEEYSFMHSREKELYNFMRQEEYSFMHSREKELYNFMRISINAFSQRLVI